MLILSRKIGENIKISNNVTVALLSIKGNQARIGIDAPKDIAVDREEIYDRKQQVKHSKHQTKI